MPVTSGKIGPNPMSPREYMQESEAPNTAKPQLPKGDSAVAPTTGRLLVLIRYNQPNVEYEQQLSAAVSTALQRKPDAEFSVIAVMPASGDPSELALAPSRITMGSSQTQDARTAEVHVYVR